MKLYLVRHASAEGQATDGGPDSERRLTFHGRKEVERVGEALREKGAGILLVLASPARRAQETAKILCGTLESPPPVKVEPSLAPGASPTAFLDLIAIHAGEAELAIVAHNPDLSILCAGLLPGPAGGTIHFMPASIWCLEFDPAQSPPSASLLWTHHPG